MFRLMQTLLADRKGSTAIEYGLIASIIVITMIASLTQLANATSGLWNNISGKVQNVAGN